MLTCRTVFPRSGPGLKTDLLAVVFTGHSISEPIPPLC
ncbi:hypothetical protein AT864_01975 [Anoxybacillus sp. P3H1B]|nr:hypothetical protein AT864_01975 [Anoxybacillus sp. P3H1B]